MKIEVLGSGCAKCEKLLKNAIKAVEEAEVSCDVEKITDMKKIMEMGVMMTPALAVNGEVKVFGTILSPDEIKKLLK